MDAFCAGADLWRWAFELLEKYTSLLPEKSYYSDCGINSVYNSEEIKPTQWWAVQHQHRRCKSSFPKRNVHIITAALNGPFIRGFRKRSRIRVVLSPRIISRGKGLFIASIINCPRARVTPSRASNQPPKVVLKLSPVF